MASYHGLIVAFQSTPSPIEIFEVDLVVRATEMGIYTELHSLWRAFVSACLNVH